MIKTTQVEQKWATSVFMKNKREKNRKKVTIKFRTFSYAHKSFFFPSFFVNISYGNLCKSTVLYVRYEKIITYLSPGV